MNYDSLKKYQDFGSEFEKIYFTNVQNEMTLMKKYYYYLDLQTKLNTYESTGSIEQVNYITEVIYFMFRCCFANRMKRLSFKERFWVLDGRPKEGYNHNFYTNMNKHFKRNFDLTNVSKKSGNTTLQDISGNHNSKHTLVSFDIENPPPNKNRDNDEYDYRGSKFLQSSNIITEVPEDEDLTEEEEDEQNNEEEEEEEQNYEKEDENRIDSICSEINTVTKVHIFDAVKEFYVNKKITEYDMIKRMMKESPEYSDYLYRFKIRKYLRRLKVPPVKATNEMKRLSEKIKKEYERKEKTAKYMFDKTHGKNGVPPLNFRR
jgi:hypothetical protein